MSLEKVWLIPLCTFLFSLAAFLSSYIIAVSRHHVMIFCPYISDSGALPPESCIFAQLLNMAALFLAATVYLRHRQIVEFYWHRFKLIGHWRHISCVTLWLGYASALGVSLVGNFQEGNVLFVHYFGAFMAFGCGLIYVWAQTAFSFKMNPKLASPMVSYCRLFMCVIATVCFVITIIFGPILGRQPIGYVSTCGSLYHWTGEEPNYAAHITGTLAEWLLAVIFQLYILSFAIELRHAFCHAPKLKLIAIYEDESIGTVECDVNRGGNENGKQQETVVVCNDDKELGHCAKVTARSAATADDGTSPPPPYTINMRMMKPVMVKPRRHSVIYPTTIQRTRDIWTTPLSYDERVEMKL